MNKLFYGDNLDILRKPNVIPSDSVDLCYIDPPFNSKRNYNQIYNNIGSEDRAQAQAFMDTWKWDDYTDACYNEILGNNEGRFTEQTVELIKGLALILNKGDLLAYLVSMTLRINEIQRVLKPTGSFYLHCDPTASHYLKLVLDAIFLPRGGDFLNEIVWRRTTNTGSSKSIAKRFASNSDIIFFYAKSKEFTFNQVRTDYSDYYLKRFNKQDERGFYYLDNLKTYSQERLESLIAESRVEYTSNGKPRIKNYLHELKGLILDNIWTDIQSLNSQAAERLGYPTQKPEALLERILLASSNKGDVVMDAYCGCGTTVAVAQRLGRQWIGLDITYQSIALILRRLEAAFGKEVADEVILSGVPKDMASAEALALKKDDRTRKEFEKWALLSYSNNRAIINEKKGADGGVDGIAYTQTGGDSNAKVVFQVKSGNVKSGDIDALVGVMSKVGAELAVFITLKDATAPMKGAAASAGTWLHPVMNKRYPRVKIVTIKEMLEGGARLDLPMSIEVLKKATAVTKNDQLTLDTSNDPPEDEIQDEA